MSLQERYTRVPVAHKYNRTAFLAVADDRSSSMLLRLYSALVAVEFGLKDGQPAWLGGHDVPNLLANANEQSLSAQLQGKLAALRCTSIQGSDTAVRADKYPDLRYLRHENDFPGCSKEKEVEDAFEVAKDAVLALRQKGIL